MSLRRVSNKAFCSSVNGSSSSSQLSPSNSRLVIPGRRGRLRTRKAGFLFLLVAIAVASRLAYRAFERADIGGRPSVTLFAVAEDDPVTLSFARAGRISSEVPVSYKEKARTHDEDR